MSRAATVGATLATAVVVTAGCLTGVAWPARPTQLNRLLPDGRWTIGEDATRLTVETRRMGTGAAAVGAPMPVVSVLPKERRELLRTVLHGPRQSLQLVQGVERGGLVTYGFVADEQSFAFDEPRLDLPVDLVDGATWSGTTTVSPTRSSAKRAPFSYEGRLHADGDCWVVERTDRVVDGEPRTWRERRCPDVGLTSWGFEGSELDAVEARDPLRTSASTAPAPPRAPAAGATPKELGVVGGSRSTAMIGTPSGWVGASDGGEVLFVPADGTAPTSVLAGGDVTAVGAAGEVVLVATTDRRLEAYSPQATWLWQVPLADAALVAPVGVTDDLAVVATVSGEVLGVDPRTGEERWRRQVGGSVDVALLALDRAVVVATVDGNLVAFDVDGEQRWSRPGGGGRVDAMARIDDDVLFAADGRLVRLAGGDGDERWTRYVAADDLGVVGRLVLARNGTAVSARQVDDGARAWELDASCTRLLADGSRAVCVVDKQPALVEPDGTLAPLPPVTCSAWSLGPAGLLGTTDTVSRWLWGAR